MVVYSFSQLGLYQQCPKKYQFRYLEGLEKSFETTPDLLLGTSVHSSLERFYQQLNIYKKPQKSDLVEYFDIQRSKSLQENGEKIVMKGDQTLDDYQRRGQHYLSDYYDLHTPFEDIKIVGTELLLHFTLEDGPNAPKFRGIVDRLDKDGENFIINDYKTNKNLPPEQKDEYREQLTLYAQGIRQKYGKYFKNIKARLHYLHFGLVDEREITDENLDPILQKYKNLISEIETARFDHNMGVENAFPTNQNPYCKYCEYQMLCPLWTHLHYGAETINAGELGEQTIASLVDQYAQLSSQISQDTKQKDFLKELLVAYASEHDFEQLFGSETKLGVSKSQTFSAKDKLALQKLLSELGILDEYSDIPYYKLAALVKDKKLTPDQVSTYLDAKDSRTLRASKKKES
ncbi:MAG: PD-(D/E)XK nuclease family protein [candidate division SR1 bacterium]|nr:PD-(D/E)XK nuclease family protein [candidate division SR1 bacterium]